MCAGSPPSVRAAWHVGCAGWLLIGIALSWASPLSAASPPRADGIDRSHPLGLEYYQPYGIVSTAYVTPHVKWG